MTDRASAISRGASGAGLRERLPALNGAQVEASRLLFRSQICWPVPNDRMLAVAPLRRRGGMGGVFELDGDGTRLALRLDGTGTGASPEWSDYSGRSRLLAWSLAHEATLMALSEALGAPLVPIAERTAGDDANDEASLWLAFSIEDLYEPEDGASAHYQSGELQLPLGWLQRLLVRAEPLDPEQPLPDLSAWRDLPAPVCVQCPGPRITATDWRSLRPGDVLIVGSRSQPPALHAQANGRRWPLIASPHGYQVTGAVQTIHTLLENAAMNDTEASPDNGVAADNDGDAATRSLPVLVEFELGRLELTMGELAGLQPGYVFALPAFVEGTNVTIRANGRACARGELVAVGDTLGVRLVAWS